MGLELRNTPEPPSQVQGAGQTRQAPSTPATPAPAAHGGQPVVSALGTGEQTQITPGVTEASPLTTPHVQFVDLPPAAGHASDTPAADHAPPHQPHPTPAPTPTDETPAPTPAPASPRPPALAAMPAEVAQVVQDAKNVALEQLFSMMDAAYARHIAALRQQQEQDRHDAPVNAAIANAENQRRAMQAFAQAVSSGDAAAQQEAARRFSQAAAH